jgi:hypothetical protein
MFGQTYGTYNGSTQTATTTTTNAYSTSLNEYNQSTPPSILNSVYVTNAPESLFNCYRMEPKNAMMKQANALGFGYPFGNAAANCYLNAAAVAAAAAAAANSNNHAPVDSSLSTNYNSFSANTQQMQHSYGNQSMMNNESQLSLTPTSSSSSSSASSASSVSSSSKGTKSTDYSSHSKLDNEQTRVDKNLQWSNDLNKSLNSWQKERKGEYSIN